MSEHNSNLYIQNSARAGLMSNFALLGLSLTLGKTFLSILFAQNQLLSFSVYDS